MSDLLLNIPQAPILNYQKSQEEYALQCTELRMKAVRDCGTKPVITTPREPLWVGSIKICRPSRFGEPETPATFVRDIVPRENWVNYLKDVSSPTSPPILQRIPTIIGRNQMFDGVPVTSIAKHLQNLGSPYDCSIVLADVKFERVLEILSSIEDHYFAAEIIREFPVNFRQLVLKSVCYRLVEKYCSNFLRHLKIPPTPHQMIDESLALDNVWSDFVSRNPLPHFALDAPWPESAPPIADLLYPPPNRSPPSPASNQSNRNVITVRTREVSTELGSIS